MLNISLDGLVAMLACLLVAILPMPRRAEGLRIGFFSALMAFVFVDAIRQGTTDDDLAAIPAPSPEPLPEPAAEEVPALAETVPVDMAPVAEEDRLSAVELLTGFSVLRHLRRTGAVSDDEYEAKKTDILRRV